MILGTTEKRWCLLTYVTKLLAMPRFQQWYGVHLRLGEL